MVQLTLNPRKSYGTKKLHNKKGYHDLIIDLSEIVKMKATYNANFARKVLLNTYIHLYIYK